MDNVQFEEEKVNSQFFRKSQVYRGLASLIIKMGLAKNEVQANLVMVIIMVICAVGIIFVFIGRGSSAAPKSAVSLTDQQILEMMSRK